jgi:hypothetical protein
VIKPEESQTNQDQPPYSQTIDDMLRTFSTEKEQSDCLRQEFN